MFAVADNKPEKDSNTDLLKRITQLEKELKQANKGKSKEEAEVQPVLAVSANMSPTKIYVTAKVNGEPVKCLLDSGCERSVLAADLAPNANLTPSQFSLFAANRASLDVLGDTTLLFVITVTTSRPTCLCLTRLKVSCLEAIG